MLQAGMWLVATALFTILIRSVDLGRTWALGQEVRGAWIAAAVGCNLLVLPLWAEQWRTLLPPSSPVAPKRMLSIASQLAFLGNALPASGQVSAVILLRREPGVTSAAALSALALEQVTEGVVKVGVLLLAAAFLPIPAWMHQALIVLAAVVAVLTTAVVVAAMHHERIATMSGNASQHRAFGRVATLVASWARDLESLRRPSRFALALACCVGTKTVELMAIVAVQHAFGLSLPFSTTLLVLAAAILGTIAPVAPANLGVYEGAVVAAYRHAGVHRKPRWRSRSCSTSVSCSAPRRLDTSFSALGEWPAPAPPEGRPSGHVASGRSFDQNPVASIRVGAPFVGLLLPRRMTPPDNETDEPSENEPLVSRRSVIVGAALAASAKLLQQTPATPAPQVPATVPDPTTVQGRTPNELGERAAFVRSRRKLSNSGTSSQTPLHDLYGTITPADLHYERHHARRAGRRSRRRTAARSTAWSSGR